jgi:hypothetical protein
MFDVRQIRSMLSGYAIYDSPVFDDIPASPSTIFLDAIYTVCACTLIATSIHSTVWVERQVKTQGPNLGNALDPEG